VPDLSPECFLGFLLPLELLGPEELSLSFHQFHRLFQRAVSPGADVGDRGRDGHIRMRILLDMELPKENAPQCDADIGNLWVDHSKEYKESRKVEPIFVKNAHCGASTGMRTKKAQKEAEGYSGEPGAERRFHARDRVHTKAHLASAPRYRDHLLEWVITSNDTQIFNVLTTVVRFGNGSWGRMFAPKLGPKGSGTPVNMLPN